MQYTNRRLAITQLAFAALGCAAPLAHAALVTGAKAPAFTTQAAQGGKAFDFNLAEALARGPVVLYFFPKAFTQGCTIEAHEFAEATPRFQAMGATVIGVSNDGIDALKRFSVEACRDKFAVASDPEAKVIRAYDAQLAARPGMADRISYVIDRNGSVAFVHAGADPTAHVAQTLQAVERLAGAASKR